jgi:UDP-N-acetylmuramate dehydrogenase
VVSAARRGELAATLDRVAKSLGPLAARDVALGPLTTYRVGGPAALLVTARDHDDLEALRAALDGADVPVLVVGRGSNLLVADAGFPGVAVRLGQAFAMVERVGEGSVRAGAACDFPVLARRTVQWGLRGLEWAVGIPGTVGGAVRMNAGGHGSDTAACLTRFRFTDLASARGGEADVATLSYGYRSSSVRPTDVVEWAEFSLQPGDAAEGKRLVSEIVRWRREHQPGGSNAGSVFTNPEGDSAGRLVDEAGLKGFRLGSAQVSPKHANFIQADEGGSADDVAALMAHVRAEVASRFGVELEAEVRLIGFGDGQTDGVTWEGGVT